jgi:hypothetical protein
VPKVQHKPIKSPRKGSNKRSKRQPKAVLVWRTGLSGVPPDSVQCTRVDQLQLASFENLGSHSAIIHRTVRCAKRSNGYLRQRSSATATVNSEQCQLRAQSQSRRQKAHRTVNRSCPVHHRTVRWPTCQKLQRSNPNGWVTWLAHRTVFGGAPDCPVRHTTAAFTNGHFGGWGYKYPPTTTLQCIQVFSHQTSYKSSRLHSKTQRKRSNPLPSPESLQTY